MKNNIAVWRIDDIMYIRVSHSRCKVKSGKADVICGRDRVKSPADIA